MRYAIRAGYEIVKEETASELESTHGNIARAMKQSGKVALLTLRRGGAHFTAAAFADGRTTKYVKAPV